MLASGVAAAAATSAGFMEPLLAGRAARREAADSVIGAGSAFQIGRNLGRVWRGHDPSLAKRIKPLRGLRSGYPRSRAARWRLRAWPEVLLGSRDSIPCSLPKLPRRHYRGHEARVRRSGGFLMGAFEAYAW